MTQLLLALALLGNVAPPPIHVEPVGPLKKLGPEHLFVRFGEKRFCDGRVYPPGGRPHLSWEAFASEIEYEALVQRYLKKLGEKNYERTKNGSVWRVPTEKPEKVLSIYPASYAGPWRDCELPPATRAVVEISTLPRG